MTVSPMPDVLVTVKVKLPSGVDDETLPLVIRFNSSASAMICAGSVTSLISPSPPVEKAMLSGVCVVEKVVVPSGVHDVSEVQVDTGTVKVTGTLPLASSAVMPE